MSIAPPVEPAGEGWEAAVGLRHAVRDAVMRSLDEPDLSGD